MPVGKALSEDDGINIAYLEILVTHCQRYVVIKCKCVVFKWKAVLSVNGSRKTLIRVEIATQP